jgi:hypothetical protein
MGVCTIVLCSLATVTSCRPLCADSYKIPEGRNLYLYSSSLWQDLTRLEMVTLLCMEDKTHSTLTEQMPEKNGSGVTENFERVLADVGQFREPQFEAGGTMQQGMYAPQPAVWETMYDPVYVLLRAVHRKDFQSSFDRFIS